MSDASISCFTLKGKQIKWGISCTKKEREACFNHFMTTVDEISLSSAQSVGNYTIIRSAIFPLMFIKVGQLNENVNQTIYVRLNEDDNDVRVIIMSISDTLDNIIDKLNIAEYYQHCPLYYEYNCQQYVNLLKNAEFMKKFNELKQQRISCDEKNADLTIRERSIKEEHDKAYSDHFTRNNRLLKEKTAYEILEHNLCHKRDTLEASLTAINTLCESVHYDLYDVLRVRLDDQRIAICGESILLDALHKKMLAEQMVLDNEFIKYKEICKELDPKAKIISEERLALDILKQGLESEIAKLNQLIGA